MADERKKKVQKKYQKLEKKLDWFDDENLVKADKWNKVCILKHMFTLQELEADPTLLLDLKEDIREECEKVGEVTNVIIYDVGFSAVFFVIVVFVADSEFAVW